MWQRRGLRGGIGFKVKCRNVTGQVAWVEDEGQVEEDGIVLRNGKVVHHHWPLLLLHWHPPSKLQMEKKVMGGGGGG